MDGHANLLGAYLKERRARLDPADFGLPLARRRTPGLRREEVAQLAHVSATWYTWLEQGRGGRPSADVLDRLARALSLSEAEREHLYLLAQDRLPPIEAGVHSGVPQRVQRVLDALVDSPAIVKTPDWTVRAWNRAATKVMIDYGALAVSERNVLRNLFRPGGHDHLENWDSLARLMVGSVRLDILRTGRAAETATLIEDLSRQSEEFRQIWAEQDVNTSSGGTKVMIHPLAGRLSLEFSTFAIDGVSDLAMVIFNPMSDEDRDKIRALVSG